MTEDTCTHKNFPYIWITKLKTLTERKKVISRKKSMQDLSTQLLLIFWTLGKKNHLWLTVHLFFLACLYFFDLQLTIFYVIFKIWSWIWKYSVIFTSVKVICFCKIKDASQHILLLRKTLLSSTGGKMVPFIQRARWYYLSHPHAQEIAYVHSPLLSKQHYV